MPYEITQSCYNENCDNTRAEYIMTAVSFEAGMQTANQMNRSREDKCPRCGETMGFFVSEKVD